MEIKQGAISFDVESSISPLKRFRKIVYKPGNYTSQKIFGIMDFNTINIHCNFISVDKDNGNKTDILYTFTLIESPAYQTNITPVNAFYQNNTEERMENIEFQITDEQGRTIDFNGDVICLTLPLI